MDLTPWPIYKCQNFVIWAKIDGVVPGLGYILSFSLNNKIVQNNNIPLKCHVINISAVVVNFRATDGIARGMMMHL